MGGGGVTGQKVEDLQSIVHSAARRNPVAQDRFLTGIVNPWLEIELRCALRPSNGPAGEATRDFLHVFLRVTAVDAKRVEFHQLALVCYVEAVYSFIRHQSTHTTCC